jgi:photosystem II stability/assembly factor-like uncharacterized protein
MNTWKQLGPKVVPKGQTYSNVRVNVTGRITTMVIHPQDPNTIFVGAAQGGIWKTINGGKHWSPTSDNAISLAIGALAMDPSNPEVLYAGTGEGNFGGDSQYGLGILKTTEGGLSWDLKGMDTFIGSRFCRIAVNPKKSNYIFAATTEPAAGIYRSTDAGETWSKLTSGLPSSSNATDIVLDPSNPDTAYAAFWGEGIYKTTNASAATPGWTKLTGGLPASGFTRISIGISPSSPQTLYALMSGPRTATSSSSYLVNQFYSTVDGGNTWNRIPLPLAGNIGAQGFYNLNVAVDPTTPDIVYLSGVSVWKAVRSSSDGSWNITNIGSTIHADNHALAFDPKNHLKIYAGNDGGIYRSDDGGSTWIDSINKGIDSINKGLYITQFEFMEQDLEDEKRIFAGTQDNGTVRYEGKPEFYHAADGDGGFVCIDPNQPQNVWHTYYNLSPELSSEGGDSGTWKRLYDSIRPDPSNFYPPMTLDKANSNNIAIGGQKLYIDYSKGEDGWTDRIDLNLPQNDLISAINFVNSNLIYVGTNFGGVYRVTRSENKWTPRPIHSSPFPGRYVWDVATLPSDENKIIAVVSGFNTPHVFRGVVSPQNNSATWTDISGTGNGRLPDIPVNALAIDDNKESTMYIGTDVGVFCTLDGGTSWMKFSRGLPACQIYDLRLNSSKGLLRAATHGRGMWQWSDKIDPIVTSYPDGRLAVFWVDPRTKNLCYKNQRVANGDWEPNSLITNLNIPFGSRPVIVTIGGGMLEVFWTQTDTLYYACQTQPHSTIFQQETYKPRDNSLGTLSDPAVVPNDNGVLLIAFVERIMMPESNRIINFGGYLLLNPPWNFYSMFGDEPDGSRPPYYYMTGKWSPNRRPTIAQNQDGTLDVLMVDMNDKLYYRWQTTKDDFGNWFWSKDWDELGGSLANEPVVARNGDGRLELFIVNAEDGRLYHKWQTTPNGRQWSSGWDPLNAPSLPQDAPTVARDGDGRLELFMVGMDGKLYHCWQTTVENSSTKWSHNWEVLGTTTTAKTEIKWRLTSNPVVARNGDGRLELFMVGADDKIYHCRQNDVRDSTEWPDWDPL